MGNVKLEDAPYDFMEWADMISKDYEPARYWFESSFRSVCMEPRMQGSLPNTLYSDMHGDAMHGDQGMDGMDDMMDMVRDMGVDVEMTDNGINMSMDGMSVMMEDGPNGGKMTIVLGAAKVAASALALATMTLY